ncbi:hypothetical protein SNEBB_008434 [Seison nebaliae]|nr:hypothetical protein SNEBB_008434 [Seison nebaliae]
MEHAFTFADKISGYTNISAILSKKFRQKDRDRDILRRLMELEEEFANHESETVNNETKPNLITAKGVVDKYVDKYARQELGVDLSVQKIGKFKGQQPFDEWYSELMKNIINKSDDERNSIIIQLLDDTVGRDFFLTLGSHPSLTQTLNYLRKNYNKKNELVRRKEKIFHEVSKSQYITYNEYFISLLTLGRYVYLTKNSGEIAAKKKFLNDITDSSLLKQFKKNGVTIHSSIEDILQSLKDHDLLLNDSNLCSARIKGKKSTPDDNKSKTFKMKFGIPTIL